jgi:hypothetical protein
LFWLEWETTTLNPPAYRQQEICPIAVKVVDYH